MIALNRRRYMGGGGVAPFPEGYIQDGLFFHLDGADCNGSTWADKISGKVLTKTGSDVTVADGGVTFAGASAFYSTEITVPSQATGTIELVYITNSTGGYQYMLVYSSDSSGICYSYNCNSKTVWIKPSTSPGRGGFITGSVFVQSLTSGINYVNGTKITTTSGNVNRTGGYCFSVGACITNSSLARDRSSSGTLYQLRIYNRQLTEAEIIHNQQVDMAKYNIVA